MAAEDTFWTRRAPSREAGSHSQEPHEGRPVAVRAGSGWSMRHRGWSISFALAVVLVAACSAPNDAVAPFSSLVGTGTLAE